jgi:uncharacterized protein (UPF0333 family)
MKDQVSTPVAVALIVIILIVVVAGGWWYLSQSGVSADDSAALKAVQDAQPNVNPNQPQGQQPTQPGTGAQAVPQQPTY